jgi:hypothetical protein
MLFARLIFGRRYATRFAFGIFKPALKRGSTLDCRYCGNSELVAGKALNWKRGPTRDCRYRGKVKPVIGKALARKRGPFFNCRYRGGSSSSPPEKFGRRADG